MFARHPFTRRSAHRFCRKQKGGAAGKGFVMLDDYTINMSDNLSGVFMPINPSVDMSALTQSADLSGYDDLVQVMYDGSNMSADMVQSLYEYKTNIINLSGGICVSQLLLGKSQHIYAVRTPSTKNKFKASRGQKPLRNLSDLRRHHRHVLLKKQQPTAL